MCGSVSCLWTLRHMGEQGGNWTDNLPIRGRLLYLRITVAPQWWYNLLSKQNQIYWRNLTVKISMDKFLSFVWSSWPKKEEIILENFTRPWKTFECGSASSLRPPAPLPLPCAALQRISGLSDLAEKDQKVFLPAGSLFITSINHGPPLAESQRGRLPLHFTLVR